MRKLLARVYPARFRENDRLSLRLPRVTTRRRRLWEECPATFPGAWLSSEASVAATCPEILRQRILADETRARRSADGYGNWGKSQTAGGI